MDWWCWLLPVLARTRTGGRRCSSEPIVARRGSRAAVLNAGSKAGPHGHCRDTQTCRQGRRQQLRHQSISDGRRPLCGTGPRRNRRASRAAASGRRIGEGRVRAEKIARTVPYRVVGPKTPFPGGWQAFGLWLKKRFPARCVSRGGWSRRPRRAGQGGITPQARTCRAMLVAARPNPAVVTT